MKWENSSLHKALSSDWAVFAGFWACSASFSIYHWFLPVYFSCLMIFLLSVCCVLCSYYHSYLLVLFIVWVIHLVHICFFVCLCIWSFLRWRAMLQTQYVFEASQGPGGFRKLGEACRIHVYLSWRPSDFISPPAVRSIGKHAAQMRPCRPCIHRSACNDKGHSNTNNIRRGSIVRTYRGNTVEEA